MNEASISERLEEAARLVRSPLSHNADGELTETGRAAYSSLSAILHELPNIRAETTGDALALVILSRHALGGPCALLGHGFTVGARRAAA